MASVEMIWVRFETGDQQGAGTDGDIYLGIGGREFMIDSSWDDFERASDQKYAVGNPHTVLNYKINDPRKPQMDTEEVKAFPAYVRFSPKTRTDRWNFDVVWVGINNDSFNKLHFYRNIRITNGVREEGWWLGVHSGLFLYLHRNLHSEL